MKCSQCGHTLPQGSQFCLRCGAATTPPGNAPGSTPTTMPGSRPIGAAPGALPVRPSGPPKTLIAMLILLAASLIGVTAAVVHSRGGLASGTAGSANGSGIAVATAPNAPQTGLANANGARANGAGLANASVTPLGGGGLANATGPSMNGRGLANATAPSMNGRGLANQPAGPPPANAQPMDDVMPYLRALARIEAERQQINASFNQRLSGIFAGYAGGPQGANADAVTTNMLSQLMSGDLGDGLDKITKDLGQLQPAVQEMAADHVHLVQEVDSLQQSPGVPPSCRDLQGYYRAAMTPFISLANAESQNNPVSVSNGQMNTHSAVSSEKINNLEKLLQQLPGAQAEESTRLTEAEQALDQVFRSHNIQPFFAVKDTEANGGGGGGGIMSAPYVPGQ